MGITGADAADFLMAYKNYFNVDVSQFKAADHFEGEGMNILTGNGGKKDLTLGDLEKGIIAGRLNEEVLR